MFEGFLNEVREKGEVRVLAEQQSHSISQIEIQPIVTRTNQIGVMLQDRSSGKSFMIEVENVGDTGKLIVDFAGALDKAISLKNRFNRMLQEKVLPPH